MADTLLEAENVQIYETRGIGSPCSNAGYYISRPENCVALCWNYWKLSDSFLKSFNEQYFAYQHLQKNIYRPIEWCERRWGLLEVIEFIITIEIEVSSNPKLISTLLQRLCSFFPHCVSRGLSRSESNGRHRKHFETHSYTGRESYSNWKCVCFC